MIKILFKKIIKPLIVTYFCILTKSGSSQSFITHYVISFYYTMLVYPLDIFECPNYDSFLCFATYGCYNPCILLYLHVRHIRIVK